MMKLSFAYSSYLFFIALAAISVIGWKCHVLLRRTGIAIGNISYENNATRAHVADNKLFDPQEFVFCNSDALARFEYKKKERSQHLFEKLCGIKQISQPFLRRATWYAITMHHTVLAHCSRQQFGIPCMVSTSDVLSDKNLFVKQIAIKQAIEKKVSQKSCRFSALEKLFQ